MKSINMRRMLHSDMTNWMHIALTKITSIECINDLDRLLRRRMDDIRLTVWDIYIIRRS